MSHGEQKNKATVKRLKVQQKREVQIKYQNQGIKIQTYQWGRRHGEMERGRRNELTNT